MRMTGTVKFFNTAKGFGFITLHASTWTDCPGAHRHYIVLQQDRVAQPAIQAASTRTQVADTEDSAVAETLPAGDGVDEATSEASEDDVVLDDEQDDAEVSGLIGQDVTEPNERWLSASYPTTHELQSPRAAQSLMIRLRPTIVDLAIASQRRLLSLRTGWQGLQWH
jgi:hypothetical protein